MFFLIFNIAHTYHFAHVAQTVRRDEAVESLLSLLRAGGLRHSDPDSSVLSVVGLGGHIVGGLGVAPVGR